MESANVPGGRGWELPVPYWISMSGVIAAPLASSATPWVELRSCAHP
jgi:hypothetical protein